MNRNNLEVGQEIVVEGRRYWISKIVGPDCLEVMPNPDDAKRKARSNFWPTFWAIVLIIVILKLIF